MVNRPIPLWTSFFQDKIPRAAAAVLFGFCLGLTLGSISQESGTAPAQQDDSSLSVAPQQTRSGALAPEPAASQISSPPPPEEEAKGAPPLIQTPPWQRFAQPAPLRRGWPTIAIVIDDMGVDRKRSHRAMQILGPLTLSFLPDGPDLELQTNIAHSAGHELMLHMPMEPLGNDADPGPYALRTNLSDGENLRRLQAAFNRFGGYVGINNHMGSRFTASLSGMSLVMGELQRRGLLWLDSRTSAKSAGPMLAQRFAIPWAERDVFLDDNPSRQAVEKQLLAVEKLARRRGQAVAIGHPRDATLDALEAWVYGLENKGLVLAPLSEIVRRRQPVFAAESGRFMGRTPLRLANEGGQ